MHAFFVCVAVMCIVRDIYCSETRVLFFFFVDWSSIFLPYDYYLSK